MKTKIAVVAYATPNVMYKIAMPAEWAEMLFATKNNYLIQQTLQSMAVGDLPEPMKRYVQVEARINFSPPSDERWQEKELVMDEAVHFTDDDFKALLKHVNINKDKPQDDA